MKHPEQNVMPHPSLAIRVISLDDSGERRALVRANLETCPVPWAFLDGSRPGDASLLTDDAAAQRARFGREMTPGEVGCFRSHMRALDAFDTDPALDWLLVMEDDVWLDPAFPYAELAGWLTTRNIGYLRLFAREWRRVVRPIDDEFGRFWENGLDNHVLFPFPMIERHGTSTLNTARTGAAHAPSTPGWRRKLTRARDFLAKRAYLAWRLSPLAHDRIRPVKR